MMKAMEKRQEARKNQEKTCLLYTSKGQASVKGLYLGKYYVKEITPPTGYLAEDVYKRQHQHLP